MAKDESGKIVEDANSIASEATIKVKGDDLFSEGCGTSHDGEDVVYPSPCPRCKSSTLTELRG